MNTQSCISDADLARLWDQELTPGQREDLEHHLQGCPSCQARWDAMAAGARHFEASLRAAAQAAPAASCPSDELVARYLGGALDQQQKQEVEAHLARCPSCREEVRMTQEALAADDRDGAQWWADYTGRQVLAVLARVPAEIDQLALVIGRPMPFVRPCAQPVALSIFAPTRTAGVALAAATGEGVAEQVLRQDSPPFELRLVRFGQQRRFTVRPLGEDSPYRDCLARIELLEGSTCRYSRILVITEGEGQCVLEPGEALAVTPQTTALTARVVPLLALAHLHEAGGEPYVAILTRLLSSAEKPVRPFVVEVLGRIGGPAVRPLLESLANDPDPAIRAAAANALKSWPPISSSGPSGSAL